MSNFIIQVALDVWYESSYPTVALLSDIYKIGYTTITETPFRNMPPEIRNSNPNFKYQPMYEISSPENHYKINVGDKIFGVSASAYISWDDFIQDTKKIFNVLFSNSTSDLKISRIGLRYLDMLDNINIFDNSHIRLEISSESKSKSNAINIRFDNIIESCNVVETIVYPVEKINNKEVLGTLIDIITAKEQIKDIDQDNFYSIANKLHEIQKNQFKKILTDELRRQINI